MQIPVELFCLWYFLYQRFWHRKDLTNLGLCAQYLTRIWEEEIFPTKWKQAIIVPIYKKKDKLDCNNYRGVSLLCHCSKILTSILMERINRRTEEILSEEQAGFRPSRSSIDQIFTLCRLSEKYIDTSRNLFIRYVDFRKAFDSIWRTRLWRVMRSMIYPETIIRILENLYRDTFSAVRIGADLWFETIAGIFQGCILSPLLFNIFLEVVMAMALGENNVGAAMNAKHHQQPLICRRHSSYNGEWRRVTKPH